MSLKIITLSVFLVCLNSCTVPKQSRAFKKATQSWRQSGEVLKAYADTPLHGIFLTLRENGRFEHTSSGLFGSFKAGTWTHRHDTVCLVYLNIEQNVLHKQDVYVHRLSHVLLFDDDTANAPLKFRITLNKL